MKHLPKAIIVDIDGTIADTPSVPHELWRNFDWEEFNERNESCPSFPWMVNLVNVFHNAGYEIIFMTARDDSERVRNATLRWLHRHAPKPASHLFMRPAGDLRPDHLVKEELFTKYVLNKFAVEFAVDDKRSNCSMFRKLGINALHCTDKD